VSEVHRLAIHERTPAYDALEAAAMACPDRDVRHASLAKGTMEPNLGHIAFDALTHDLKSIARMRRDDDPIERA
jgi:hypothetical protein